MASPNTPRHPPSDTDPGYLPGDQWVEIEVEHVRTLTKRVRINASVGTPDRSAMSSEIGRFSRSLRDHVLTGVDVGAGERARLLSWRLVRPPSCNFVIEDATPGDEESGCGCLRPAGHDGEHSPFANLGGECAAR